MFGEAQPGRVPVGGYHAVLPRSKVTTPHPVPLPLGEGTLRRPYTFENYARRVRQRSLSQGERDRVRGDSLSMARRPF